MPDITSLQSHPLGETDSHSFSPDDSLQDLTGHDAIPCHPLGVKPSGNGLFANENLRHTIGTFNLLPDELILMLLESLDGLSLLRFGRTCKAFYAFTRAEELWKALFIWSPPSSFTWRGTWRSTYLNLPPSSVAILDCSSLFSDALHRPFYCAHISLDIYVKNIPSKNQITRLPDLSPEDFQAEWSDKPFILTQPVKQWPAYKSWSVDSLLAKYGDTVFRAEAVDWKLSTYVDYMRHNADESPLYLFDRAFVSKMGLKVGPPEEESEAAYWPPPCFGEDFFSVLGNDRPDRQWLIVGPERSGSTFHKDPNATSAWNAVVRGSKYWIMFPSSSQLPPPPGVFVSDDQSEVTSPLSIAEWLLGFHAEARRTPGCIEGICGEGEILYVPSGWWHLVVNLEPSIAITQNFTPRAHLTATLDFLSNKADQVSGFRKDVHNPYERFVENMRKSHPELLQQALDELKKKSDGRKRKWDELVHGKVAQEGAEAASEAGGFSFGFGDDGSDVEVP
ncbi:putative F-box and JmjC domain protein [Aspergillus novofumigatus IBT 16806]|uniref:Putative F-box and JmjC domain protein n=1 Tax=Aspergillus novofumigatus (strain IBT 16806) TaxID=1392255 RepID=A0A2I1C2K2_ASPN1|nr:putative F-box and JmjC domain protein [Aspergillus novofumigatus IBT 16806]PKX91852.1 putative F-box and JmjC domain protein [Aspergillus novofumigatus IBT 16806]